MVNVQNALKRVEYKLPKEVTDQGIEIIAEAGCPVSVTITRLSEFFQATEGNLTDVYAAGLLPGMSIEVKDDADGIRLTGPDGSVVVDPEVLSGLFVVQNS